MNGFERRLSLVVLADKIQLRAAGSAVSKSTSSSCDYRIVMRLTLGHGILHQAIGLLCRTKGSRKLRSPEAV